MEERILLVEDDAPRIHRKLNFGERGVGEVRSNHLLRGWVNRSRLLLAYAVRP
jgi:hypothetical protein